MTKASGPGFGYTKSKWVDDELISLSSDSNLSSTSLLKNLIEPSKSEEFFFSDRKEEEAEEKYRLTRRSIQRSLLYVRRSGIEHIEGMNLDYGKRKDDEKGLERQSVPRLSAKSRATLLRRFSPNDYLTSDLVIPMLNPENFTSSQKRHSSTISQLFEPFRNSSPNQQRSYYIKLNKEKLEEEFNKAKMQEDEMSKGEKKMRVKKEMVDKKREEDVFKRHTEEEKLVIKKTLGRVPTMKRSAYIPFGKKRILSERINDPEDFFEDEDIAHPRNYYEYIDSLYEDSSDDGSISQKSE